MGIVIMEDDDQTELFVLHAQSTLLKKVAKKHDLIEVLPTNMVETAI